MCISILGYRLLVGWGSCLSGRNFCMSEIFCNWRFDVYGFRGNQTCRALDSANVRPGAILVVECNAYL